MLQIASSRSSLGSLVCTEDAYEVPEITLSIPAEKLEVLGDLLVEFENMKGNEINLLPIVNFQGWESFSNRLQGPIFFNLVSEFWIHAKPSPFQVTSFVFGKKIVIYEKLIAILIGHDGSGIRCEQMVEKE